MKVFRPGLPPVFTDEDAVNQPAPKKADPKANMQFPTPEQAKLAAAVRHVQATGQQPHDAPKTDPEDLPAPPAPPPTPPAAPPATQIIPPVAPKPLVDHTNDPPPNAPVAGTAGNIQPAGANTSTELTPEEQAELDALIAKRDHTTHTEPHS